MELTDIIIETEIIQLDQFLKWAGIIDTGGQIKYLLADHSVTVNGQIVKEKRKKLHPGDIIEIENSGRWRICREI